MATFVGTNLGTRRRSGQAWQRARALEFRTFTDKLARTTVPRLGGDARVGDEADPAAGPVLDEDVLEQAATHPDRRLCNCGGRRALKRRPWASISSTTDGPKWVFLWRCACGSDAFDHAEGA